MYLKVIHSLKAELLMEGATDTAPSTFDYITIDGTEYQVVQTVTKFTIAEQGPFSEQYLSQLVTIYVEEPPESEQDTA